MTLKDMTLQELYTKNLERELVSAKNNTTKTDDPPEGCVFCPMCLNDRKYLRKLENTYICSECLSEWYV